MAPAARRPSKEGRPNINAKGIQHRQLLQPGPVPKELKIRASPYQALVCNAPKKRKADSLTDGSSASIQEYSPNADLTALRPVKNLKVIHHQFSNGENGEIQSYETSGETTPISNSTHLLYKNGCGRWKPVRNHPRKNTGVSSDHKRSSPKSLNRSAGAPKEKSTPAKRTSTLFENNTEHDPAGSLDGEVRHTSDKEALSDSHTSPDSAAEHILAPDFRSFTSTSVATESHVNNFEANQYCENSPLLHFHDNNYLEESSVQLPQPLHMSLRDLVVDLSPEPTPAIQVLDHHHHQRANIESDQAIRALSKIIFASDQIPLTTHASMSPTSAPVSPIATGTVWESRATRAARRRGAEFTSNNVSTPTVTIPDNLTQFDPSSTSNGAGGYPLPSSLRTGNHSTPNTNSITNGLDYTVLINNANNANSSLSPIHSPTPPRFRNQDSNCLICLSPVTSEDLEVDDLRCSACPRTFHHRCLSYIPPRMNQNWRCSLCYKEAWYGYGASEEERNFANPSLVERYRRRLLIAKTYAPAAVSGEAAVKFWFDVDLDGSVGGDQKVLVGIGVVNEHFLRWARGGEVGLHGRGGVTVPTPAGVGEVERVERWGIALGMALQQEEGRREELEREVERLKRVVYEREREIEDLESGL